VLPSRTWLLAILGALALSCGGNVVVDHGSSGSSGSSGGGGHGGHGGHGGGGSGGDAPSCDAPAIAASNGACFTNVGACNPVTGAPCAVDQGQSCDIGPSGFACFSGNNAEALCQSCNNKGGPFCGATLTCLSDERCTRYCCDDGDCGSGHCDTHGVGGGVGVCFQ
jgi:hypothetical protein